MVARLKLKLKKRLTATDRRKYNVGLLKDPQTRQKSQLNLANKFQSATTANSTRTAGGRTPKRHCHREVGPRKEQQREWILTENLRMIQVRKEKKTAVNNSRTTPQSERKGMSYRSQQRSKEECKTDRRNYIGSLAEEVEQPARSGNMRKLYETAA